VQDFCRATLCWNSGWWQKPAGCFSSLIEASSGDQGRREAVRASSQKRSSFAEGESGYDWLQHRPHESVTK